MSSLLQISHKSTKTHNNAQLCILAIAYLAKPAIFIMRKQDERNTNRNSEADNTGTRPAPNRPGQPARSRRKRTENKRPGQTRHDTRKKLATLTNKEKMKIEKSYEKYSGLYDFATEHDFGVLKSAGYGNYGGIESEYPDYETEETIN